MGREPREGRVDGSCECMCKTPKMITNTEDERKIRSKEIKSPLNHRN